MEVEKPVKEGNQAKKFNWKKAVWNWGKVLFIAALFVTLVRGYMFTNYIVYGESMMPTIQDGERIIVNKIGYEITEPDRFDLVIFHASETNDYIKRVIGLPGDHIKYEEDVLYVNDKPVEEEFLESYREELGGEIFTEDFTLEEVSGYEAVPEDMVFVLGDNRQNSMDSRQLGFIDMDEIVGEVNVSYWPPTNIRLFK